jgi:hypothetical protein
MLLNNLARKQTLSKWATMMENDAKAKNLNLKTYVAERVNKLLAEGSIDPNSFSFRALFEAVIDPTVDLQDMQAVGMAIEASILPKITAPIAVSVVQKAYDYEIGDLLSLFRQQDAGHTQFEELVGANPISNLQVRHRGQPYQRGVITDESFKVFYKDYGIILDILFEEMMDDKNNLIVDKMSSGGEAQGKKLAGILCQTIEMDTTRAEFDETANSAYTYCGTAYSGSTAAGTDVFYSGASHSTIDGQTNINRITNSFGSEGVSEAGKALNRMTDPRGYKVKVVPTKLIGHSVMAQEFAEFLNSKELFDSMDRVNNYWNGKLSPVVSPYFADEARYFVGRPEKTATIRWVERPRTTSISVAKDAFERRIVLSYKHSLWPGVFHTDYRTLVSCNG